MDDDPALKWLEAFFVVAFTFLFVIAVFGEWQPGHPPEIEASQEQK